MKKKVLLFILLLSLNVNILNATSGQLKSSSIIECDGVLYGKHGSDNHYHVAEKTSDGKYKAKGDSLGTNWTCPTEGKNINETKTLEKTRAEFESCVDGDTAVFKINGESTKFRFLAIDTPETVHPTKGVEAFGKNASEYTCNKITNAKKIEIEYEDSKTDKYGRSLGWIWVDDSLLQKELIEAGYAEVAYIYGTYKYTSDLCETQKEAILNGSGIWEAGKRKEGYCSTIRTVERPNQKIAINNENETKNEEKENDTYTPEMITAISIALLALIIKALKK